MYLFYARGTVWDYNQFHANFLFCYQNCILVLMFTEGKEIKNVNHSLYVSLTLYYSTYPAHSSSFSARYIHSTGNSSDIANFFQIGSFLFNDTRKHFRVKGPVSLVRASQYSLSIIRRTNLVCPYAQSSQKYYLLFLS